MNLKPGCQHHNLTVEITRIYSVELPQGLHSPDLLCLVGEKSEMRVQCTNCLKVLEVPISRMFLGKSLGVSNG